MLFNSIDFAVFFPVVFFLYWFATGKNLRLQNILIVLASYVFYGWWDYRFVGLIILSTLTDYTAGILLSGTQDTAKRKWLLFISVLVNVSILGFFKYCNFFIGSFIAAFSFFGMELQPYHVNIILPVGISFYTFQTMSYTIDVYKRKFEPTRDFISFAAFVSFFPLLVAGPIERASNLLPQFYVKRNFTHKNAAEGCKQMLWGFFKKVVIADNCAIYVTRVFTNYQDFSGSTLLLAAVLFTFQIYADFSGYSDIAIGSAKLLGFNAMQNFAFPFFSRDIAEFWRRWHISLSTWFRDYVFFPLGGIRNGKLTIIRNTFILFIISGLWHGAAWNFIFWGFFCAICFLPSILIKRKKGKPYIVAKERILPNLQETFSILRTYLVLVIIFIIFRSGTVLDSFRYITGIISPSLFTQPDLRVVNRMIMGSILLSIPVLVITEWINREEHYGFKKQPKNKVLRWAVYILIAMLIINLAGEQQEFIYFQF